MQSTRIAAHSARAFYHTAIGPPPMRGLRRTVPLERAEIYIFFLHPSPFFLENFYTIVAMLLFYCTATSGASLRSHCTLWVCL
jgi:hypothetical protein